MFSSMAAIRCFPRGSVLVSGSNIAVIEHSSGGNVKRHIVQIQNQQEKVKEDEEQDIGNGKDKKAKKLDHVSPNRILASRFSPSWKYFVVCDDQKQLHLFDTTEAEWKLISRRQIEKRCTEVTFTGDEQSILVADKSGDVYRFSVLEVEKDGELLLGHLSMLLDVVLTKNNKFVVTCDRDEKIRVSHYPNSYNIHSYCLGHTQFVTRLQYIDDPEVIISGGGDGMIAVWTLQGQSLHCVHCKGQRSDSNTDAESKSSDEEIAIKCLVYDKKLRLLAVSFYNLNTIEFYALIIQDDEITLQYVTNVETHSEPWDICFDDQHCLWNLQPNQGEIIQVYSCKSTETKDIQIEKVVPDNDILGISTIIQEANSDWEFFKDSLSLPNLSTALKKVKIDNMKEYLERKQDRLSGKKLPQPYNTEPPPHSIEPPSHSTEPPSHSIKPPPHSTEPPEKKAKVS